MKTASCHFDMIRNTFRNPPLRRVPFRSEDGWVAGHVEDANTPGPCSMQCVSMARYKRIKNNIQSSRANRYHLTQYNCQSWASEQLQE